MSQTVIVAAKRTAFGKYDGILRHLEPEQSLKPLFQHFKGKYPEVVSKADDVVLSSVVGSGGSTVRKALLKTGLKGSIPGVAIDRQCGSGLEGVQYACHMIQARVGKMYIVGGVESTSRAPWEVKRPYPVYGTTLSEFYERALFTPEMNDPSMIQGTENVAKTCDVPRELQDKFAYRNHQLTAKNVKSGSISQGILPITAKGEIFNTDEGLKSHAPKDNFGRFKPVIKGGTATAASSRVKDDGAVLLLIMEKGMAYELGFEHGLLFKNGITAGVDSNFPGIGSVPVIPNLLKKNQLTIESIEVIKINEAFSTRVVACQQALNTSNTQLNVQGGALASNHPCGASGAQLVTRLFYMFDEETMITSMGIGEGPENTALFTRF